MLTLTSHPLHLEHDANRSGAKRRGAAAEISPVNVEEVAVPSVAPMCLWTVAAGFHHKEQAVKGQRSLGCILPRGATPSASAV